MRRVLALLLCITAGQVARADDWPQWLGPTRDGVSKETVAPWSGPLKVVWRQAIGEGNGTPIVAEGRVYVHSKVKDKNQEEVVAFDAATGKEIWRHTHDRPAFQSLYGNGPRSSPAIVDGKVYAFGITGLLTCLDAATGNKIWQVDALKKLEIKNLMFGMSCSPLVEGDGVLVNLGGKGASIVAFNKNTGEPNWKALDDRASYSSPIVYGEGMNRQALFFTAAGLAALNPNDGKLAWKFPIVDKLFESSTTPVRSGDLVFASSITFGSVGLQLESMDGKTTPKQLWKRADLTCYFATPVPVGEQLYVVTGTNPLVSRNSVADLHCIDFRSGKELWKKPKVGKYHATVMRTGDSKLLMLEEAGDLVLVDPNPQEYRELARAKVCGETWAHPALSNGKLYVRDNKEVICVEISK